MYWSANFAYAVGLIVADGCLSKDGRHIDFTSKDLDLIQTFLKILKLNNKIGEKKIRGNSRKYYRVQFGNVKFYAFLLDIGLMPNKSKIIGELQIPDRYFSDFLRGFFDGDGGTYSYFDPRWKNSYMLYTSFASGSLRYLEWLNLKISSLYGVEGRIGGTFENCYTLRYAKQGSLILIEKMYYKKGIPCLKRKYSKITRSLGIIAKHAGVSKLVYEHA